MNEVAAVAVAGTALALGRCGYGTPTEVEFLIPMKSFLDILHERRADEIRPRTDSGGPAAQGVRPGRRRRNWDFAFATGIECSNPRVTDRHGRSIRRDLLEECGHYKHWRQDLELVKELGTPILRYGLPNHLIHRGPGKYDW